MTVLEDFLLDGAGREDIPLCRDAHHHGLGGCEGRAVLRLPCLLGFFGMAERRLRHLHVCATEIQGCGRQHGTAKQRLQTDAGNAPQDPLPESYWTTLSSKWEVWREGYENRPYSQLEGSGQLAWKYSGFQELHLRARLAFPADGSGKAGVFCCLNLDTQRVELYKGSTLLGSYSQTISRTSNADLRGNPTMYTVEMRIRGNRVRVYSGVSYALRFTATIRGFSGGYAGYRSDNRTVCELMRLGDAWTYEPYERFDVRMPVLSPSVRSAKAVRHGMRNSRCSR